MPIASVEIKSIAEDYTTALPRRFFRVMGQQAGRWVDSDARILRVAHGRHAPCYFSKLANTSRP